MIEDRDIDPQIVRDFAAHMTAFHGASIDRTPGWLRAYARTVMGGDPDHFAFTLGTEIYMPIEIGPTVDGWSGWEQITVIAHECQHVAQGGSAGMLGRAYEYVTSKAKRVHVECGAYGAEVDLEMWRRGTIAPWWVSARARSLRSYHVGALDIRQAERHLLSLATTVRRGGYVSSAGRVAIQWLDENAPGLRHPSVRSRGAS